RRRAATVLLSTAIHEVPNPRQLPLLKPFTVELLGAVLKERPRPLHIAIARRCAVSKANLAEREAEKAIASRRGVVVLALRDRLRDDFYLPIVEREATVKLRRGILSRGRIGQKYFRETAFFDDVE